MTTPSPVAYTGLPGGQAKSMPLCILPAPVIGSARTPKGLESWKEPGAVDIGGMAGIWAALSPAAAASAATSSRDLDWT